MQNSVFIHNRKLKNGCPKMPHSGVHLCTCFFHGNRDFTDMIEVYEAGRATWMIQRPKEVTTRVLIGYVMTETEVSRMEMEERNRNAGIPEKKREKQIPLAEFLEAAPLC